MFDIFRVFSLQSQPLGHPQLPHKKKHTRSEHSVQKHDLVGFIPSEKYEFVGLDHHPQLIWENNPVTFQSPPTSYCIVKSLYWHCLYNGTGPHCMMNMLYVITVQVHQYGHLPISMLKRWYLSTNQILWYFKLVRTNSTDWANLKTFSHFLCRITLGTPKLMPCLRGSLQISCKVVPLRRYKWFINPLNTIW